MTKKDNCIPNPECEAYQQDELFDSLSEYVRNNTIYQTKQEKEWHLIVDFDEDNRMVTIKPATPFTYKPIVRK